MKKLYVNAIDTENNITHGYSLHNLTVAKNLSVIFVKEEIEFIIKSISESETKEGYLFERYCQYVVYFNVRQPLGMSMQISDFRNNSASAFDYYMNLTDAGWSEKDKIKIIEIFNEIDNNPQDIAELILEDEVDLPNS